MAELNHWEKILDQINNKVSESLKNLLVQKHILKLQSLIYENGSIFLINELFSNLSHLLPREDLDKICNEAYALYRFLDAASCYCVRKDLDSLVTIPVTKIPDLLEIEKDSLFFSLLITPHSPC